MLLLGHNYISDVEIFQCLCALCGKSLFRNACFTCVNILHELCFIIPVDLVPVGNFKKALHHSLKCVTSKADQFVATIEKAWETFKTMKTEVSNKCVLIVWERWERCEMGVYQLPLRQALCLYNLCYTMCGQRAYYPNMHKYEKHFPKM